MGVISSGVLAGVAKAALVAISVGGLSAGAYFAYQTGPGGSAGADVPAGATVSASPTAPLATLTPTTEPTAVPPTAQATATAVPPTQPPPTQPPVPTATPDTRVAIMDNPTLDQFQLGKDGKYFVADRGDGCTWVEGARRLSETVGLVVSLFTDCTTDFFFVFRPETGEIFLAME